MAGFTARPTKTHWVVPGVGAAALHAVALLFGILEHRPAPATLTSTAELTFEAELASESRANEAMPNEAMPNEAMPNEATKADEPKPSAAASAKAKTSALPRVSRATSSKPETNMPVTRNPAPSSNAADASAKHDAAPSSATDLAPHVNTDARDGASPAASAPATDTPNGAEQPNTSHSRVAKSMSGATSPRPASAVAKPRLVSSGAACQGVLNSSVTAPTKVTLVLQVSKDGSALPTSVHAESSTQIPGLELAAQRCAQRLRFLPAKAPDGSAVTASSVIKLTFSNHYTATLPRGPKPHHGAI